jgi:F-type H+-transporting ATPase subunit a
MTMKLSNSVKSIVVSIFTFVVMAFGVAFAEGHEEHEINSEVAHEGTHEEHEAFDVGKTIMEHIGDAHQWHLWGGHHDGASVYLPVILIDGGLKTFSSTHLYHGDAKTSLDGKHHYMINKELGYGIFDEKIYKLNASNELEFDGDEVLNEAPLDFSITKNTLSLLMGAFLLILIMVSVARNYKKDQVSAPKGFGKFIEPLVLFVRDDVAKANIDGPKHKKYVPYLLTIFFFILINNLLGLIPILPGGANLTGNISVTLVLAVATLLVTVFSGNKNYWKHIFATPGVPLALLPIMIPIEIVGVFTKPFALMIRLFANMTAGHIIILALISIIFINQSAMWGFLSVPMALFISVLEILVAFLQAYLFAMLSALFINAAVEEAHH